MKKTPAPHPDQTRLPLPITSPHQAVRDALMAELLDLPFHAFEACIQDLLRSLGYTEVQLLGRAAWRGRTRHGGHDVAAASHTGVTSTRVLIQLKQYRRPVSRRFVDELAGCLNRSSAEQGMIIATGGFSRAALKASQENQVVPIRLVAGAELLDLLITAQIGVQPTNEWAEWQVDHAYLRDLARPLSEPSSCVPNGFCERRIHREKGHNTEWACPPRRRLNALANAHAWRNQ